MNGKLIPDDYFLFNNFFKNIFENTISINFNHRWIASLSFLIVIFLAIYIKYICKIKDKNLEIFLIIFFVIIQFILGILTLLTNVKIHFASMHQVNSMLLLGSLIYTYYSLKKERII
jgi:cytochrome c oxidase assembly protein subunit 15